MGKKRKAGAAMAFLGMLVIILDGKTALQGARDGITLCIQTVIPSLFPFFVLSNVITGTYVGTWIPVLGPVAKVCSIPKGMESILIPAFLGGYPVGAQAVVQGWKQGQIPKQEAERLLAFCNNAGPSFLFGMVAAMFENPVAAWILWGIHILSAIIAAALIPSKCTYMGRLSSKSMTFPDMLKNAMNAMAMVCGWIILFRILIAFLERWILWCLPLPAKVVFIGVLELSNGCMALPLIQNANLRFIVASGMLAMGGLCVVMQTSSVANGLSLRPYFKGKAVQTACSLLLSVGLVSGNPLFFVILGGIFLIILVNMRKNGSIPVKAGV